MSQGPMYGPHPPMSLSKEHTSAQRKRQLRSEGYEQRMDEFYHKNEDVLNSILGMGRPEKGAGKNWGRASSRFDDALTNQHSTGRMLSTLKDFGNELPPDHPMGVNVAKMINEIKGIHSMRAGYFKGKK